MAKRPTVKAKPKGAPKRDTRFEIGNNFWQQRSTHGRKPIFASPDDLWDACLQYFAWVADNPLTEAQAFAYQGAVTVEPLPKMRAMTISGLCIFLDIDRTTWAEYVKRADFTPVTTRAEEIIRTQKFEGASAGLLNANIIARDLGLIDKVDQSSALQITFSSEDRGLL